MPDAEPTQAAKTKTQDFPTTNIDEYSEEDQQLINTLNTLVNSAQDLQPNIRKNALQLMANEIKTATSSMTSVPKPLKFLRPHYQTLKQTYQKKNGDTETQEMLADILSVLAMTMQEEGQRESLSFKMKGTKGAVGAWGHEYVRHLSAEIGEEYNARLLLADEEKDQGDDVQMEDAQIASHLKASSGLMPLALEEVVPFFISHNSEAEAIDLLTEVGQLDALLPHVDKTNCERICLYLEQLASYVPEPEDSEVLNVAVNALRQVGRFPEALRVALRLGDVELVGNLLESCQDESVRKQMSYMLARHGVRPDADEELARIMDGTHLTEHYLELARDLDVLEPKTPEDIYKSHLEKRAPSASMDSARQNLASSFVNAFVNIGFGSDKLMLTEGNKWLYKNKEHGMMSAAASLGAILCWDVDSGLSHIDKFLYMSDVNIKSGALLAVGLLNCGVRNECDPALALLAEYLEPKEQPILKSGAIFGLGMAYAGTCRDELLEMLMPVVADNDTPLDIVAISALSLGLIFTGACHEDICQALITVLIERSQSTLEAESLTRLICVGIGLLYLGRQAEADMALELAKAVPGVS